MCSHRSRIERHLSGWRRHRVVGQTGEGSAVCFNCLGGAHCDRRLNHGTTSQQLTGAGKCSDEPMWAADMFLACQEVDHFALEARRTRLGGVNLVKRGDGEGGWDRPVVPSTVWRWCFVCEMGGDSELFLASLCCTGGCTGGCTCTVHKLVGVHGYSMLDKLTTVVPVSANAEE